MRLTPEQIEETKAAVARHGGNKAAIARDLGLTRSTVANRLERVLAASSAANSNEKPRVRVPYLRAVETPPVLKEEAEAIRVCVIGDLHVAPGQDLSRLKWIARHIGETQPDHIVQIGDWASFDSVSTHDPIGSVKAKSRPSLRHDMECLRESLKLFDSELGPSTIPRIITLGNHEDRVRRYQDLRSELEDSLWIDVLQDFAQFRWKTYDFGKVTFIGGVGFVHVPLNVIGKPHSSPNIMGNNLAHDLIKGHSHRATYQTFAKIGEGQGVTLIDVGTSLPHGHVEPYAKLSQTSWWYGVHDVIIRNGRIDDFARVSMKTLQERYA
ncbi:metallophosphoesterase [Microvirga lotononidis]|uniref:metallophosphoesterase n=1 Tax=Microvirga lotononidis TaxID=864069 RepID=UPI000AE398A1|nr:metallophosphoesterase [Microvirga lotononidis]WQO25694.1 metallophosphoesterase [Microvirga lotononidis]